MKKFAYALVMVLAISAMAVTVAQAGCGSCGAHAKDVKHASKDAHMGECCIEAAEAGKGEGVPAPAASDIDRAARGRMAQHADLVPNGDLEGEVGDPAG